MKKGLKALVCFSLLFLIGDVLAVDRGTISNIATNVIGTFTGVAKLITAGAYMAGLAFAVGSIMKFKQHKDNPTNIPIGTPIALLIIAVVLLFLPTVLGVTGASMLGPDAKPTGVEGTDIIP